MPGQTSGIVGPQQMKDCGLEHPAAGRAANRPDANHALRNAIASGPKRGSPAIAIPFLGSERPQTPFDPGMTGDQLGCAQRKKSFMPNILRNRDY